MQPVILYAVRVKGTQRYLPRSQRRDERGGSHLEPVDFTDRSTWPERYAKDMMIRTYTTERAAKAMLTAWCQGKFYRDSEGDSWCKAQPDRDPNKMEVVALELHLPK